MLRSRPWWFRYRNHQSFQGISYHSSRVSDSVLRELKSVPPNEDGESSWVMFNDFLVRPVSEQEVFRFPQLWKVPAIVLLERDDVGSVLDLGKLPTQLDPSVLFQDVSLAW
jgi:PAB-dependent poly(A)-specific ribonuclease subunit 2